MDPCQGLCPGPTGALMCPPGPYTITRFTLIDRNLSAAPLSIRITGLEPTQQGFCIVSHQIYPLHLPDFLVKTQHLLESQLVQTPKQESKCWMKHFPQNQIQIQLYSTTESPLKHKVDLLPSGLDTIQTLIFLRGYCTTNQKLT